MPSWIAQVNVPTVWIRLAEYEPGATKAVAIRSDCSEGQSDLIGLYNVCGGTRGIASGLEAGASRLGYRVQ
jgi:hypothetical protein